MNYESKNHLTVFEQIPFCQDGPHLFNDFNINFTHIKYILPVLVEGSWIVAVASWRGSRFKFIYLFDATIITLLCWIF